ncbi:MAG: putative RNA methyltransferase [Oscillospiraceae bacterium]
MSHFICPICGSELNKSTDGKRLFCVKKHSFDIAKSGYVNLLMSQLPKAGHHGDDRLMVRSRRDFLNKGYYNPLLEELIKIIKCHAGVGCKILDAGCGECWYTSNIYKYLIDNHIKPEMFAVDISKDALAAGAKRNRDIELAVASAFRLPVKDSSCDIILSLFAPFSGEEFGRVLKENGVIIRAVPLEKHLLGLKAAVYDNVYENDTESVDIAGFELLGRREIREKIHLKCNEDILNIFTMTPYYYKTGAKDQEKLKSLPELETKIEFGINTYRKAGK